MEKNPQIIFISHATAEKNVALVLKSWIDEHHLGHLKAFASSSPESIPAGKKWFDEIKAALQKANLQIILCSQHSIKRPWINFEAGFAHARDIATIPLCYGGVTTDTLPMPLSHFQGINLTGSNACNDLFAAIAEHTGGQPPQVSYIDFHAALLAAITDDRANMSQPQITAEDDEPGPQIDRADSEQRQLLPTECTILLQLFNNYNTITDEYMENRLNNKIRAKYFRDLLRDNDMIVRSYSIGEVDYYEITRAGTSYLVENRLI